MTNGPETGPSQTVIAYTDGACLGNPGPGGWAVVMTRDGQRRVLKGGVARTTNNAMELMAPIKALRSMKSDAAVHFISDSLYVIKGVTEWSLAWETRGWRLAGGKPVKNVELWKELHQLCRKRTVSWEWVRGHSGQEQNEEVDRLASDEATKARVSK